MWLIYKYLIVYIIMFIRKYIKVCFYLFSLLVYLIYKSINICYYWFALFYLYISVFSSSFFLVLFKVFSSFFFRFHFVSVFLSCFVAPYCINVHFWTSLFVCFNLFVFVWCCFFLCFIIKLPLFFIFLL